MIIAIDGPAASGKGTVARRVAAYYGLAYLDTGLLYRAVARDIRARDGILDCASDAIFAANNIDPETLDDQSLRQPGVGDAASIVARIPEVRAALLDFQRAFAGRASGAVLDGRDIGTVVCPEADVKIFVTATTEIRAERRYLEWRERGELVERAAILDMIRLRDERDASRADSPMRPADDAILLDTTNLDIQKAFDTVIELIKRKIGQPSA